MSTYDIVGYQLSKWRRRAAPATAGQPQPEFKSPGPGLLVALWLSLAPGPSSAP